MKILILGASGQVGSELGTQFNDLSCVGQNGGRSILASRSDVDVADLQALREFLNHHQPDWIINATAYTAVDKAEIETTQAHGVNEHAVRGLAEYCSTNNSKLIHISTDYVFDGSGKRPFCEDSKAVPLGVYGKSKFAGEEAIRSTLAQYIILRTSWVFGAKGSNFVKTMLRVAETRGELGVVGDQYGAPTSARGIADAITTIVSHMFSAESIDKRWGTYHYSGSPFVSWAEFANEIFTRAVRSGLITNAPRVNVIDTSDYPTSAVRPANSRLDCSKLQSTFGIEPDDWKRSLGLMLNRLKERMET